MRQTDTGYRDRRLRCLYRETHGTWIGNIGDLRGYENIFPVK